MCGPETRVEGMCVCSVSPNLTTEERQLISHHLELYASLCGGGVEHLTSKQLFILIDFFSKNGKKLTAQPTLYCPSGNECVVNFCNEQGLDAASFDYLKNLKNWYLTTYFRGKLIDQMEKPNATKKEMNASQLKLVFQFFAFHGSCILQYFW